MRPRPFALERFFARTEFSARHLLSTSDCQGLTLDYLLSLAGDDLHAQWQTLSLGYTESDGAPALREEIAGLYHSAAAVEVLVAAPEEAIFLLMNALLDPGDHVVCTFPGYQSLYELARTLGCEVTFWEPEEGDVWHFDPAKLEKLVRPDTKLVVWNFPHNPTGALPSRDEFRHMLAIAQEAGAWVLSDEMYRLLEPSDELRLPAAVDLYERAVSLSGMSKVFGLAGLRIGWLTTHDAKLLQRCRELKDYTTICSSAPSELLALVGLRARDQLLREHRERVARNIEIAEGFFARQSRWFTWTAPRGGTVCFPRLLNGATSCGTHGPTCGVSAQDFCERVLRDTGVLLLPSTVYAYGDAHFRLGLGREDFGTGLEALEAYVEGGYPST